MKPNRKKIDPIDDAVIKLCELESEKINVLKGESANLWLKYLNVSTVKFNDKPIDFYRDLVEIASAIDWIDDES